MKNEPAFPSEMKITREDTMHRGLTKREYFAAMAMQGMIAGSQGLKITTEQFAFQSVALSDALLKCLNADQGGGK